jgi:hypothetical protein
MTPTFDQIIPVVIWRPVYSNYGITCAESLDWDSYHLLNVSDKNAFA